MTAERVGVLGRLLELNDGRVGVSTGYMGELRGRWPELIDEAGRVSRRAVELSALGADELPGLMGHLAAAGRPEFEYVSVHGPAKGLVADAAACAANLLELAPIAAGIVMHPETLAEPAAFGVLGSTLLLENMDPRKQDARSPDELQAYFDVLPEAGFCFDIAHAMLIDPTMALGHELFDAFQSRLREVHLSSILDDGTHVPLCASDLDRLHELLERCRGVPWILEAAPTG